MCFSILNDRRSIERVVQEVLPTRACLSIQTCPAPPPRLCWWPRPWGVFQPRSLQNTDATRTGGKIWDFICWIIGIDFNMLQFRRQHACKTNKASNYLENSIPMTTKLVNRMNRRSPTAPLVSRGYVMEHQGRSDPDHGYHRKVRNKTCFEKCDVILACAFFKKCNR